MPIANSVLAAKTAALQGPLKSLDLRCVTACAGLGGGVFVPLHCGPCGRVGVSARVVEAPGMARAAARKAQAWQCMAGCPVDGLVKATVTWAEVSGAQWKVKDEALLIRKAAGPTTAERWLRGGLGLGPRGPNRPNGAVFLGQTEPVPALVSQRNGHRKSAPL